EKAMDQMNPGDAVTIFTPDDTHFDIALYAIRKGLHVLIAKPAVKTLKEHLQLKEEARKHNVLVAIEFHKRFDPIYSDARERIRTLGDFGYFTSYMSQPKAQLHTFRSWAGTSSDISYYLNSHHIDLHCWALQGKARPVRVTASAATGVATLEPYNCAKGTEDTITLLVQGTDLEIATFYEWENLDSKSLGTAVYTASWVAPKAEVHSQQRFFYMGHKGEIRVDQAHRGYETATDADGYKSNNPLFMRYTPDAAGFYAGQNGYGHLSIEKWAQACLDIKQGKRSVRDYVEGGGSNGGARVSDLATIDETAIVTAILEAGRKSLDLGGVPVAVDAEVLGS
ncbi:hypothetical protein HK102_004184, partial [Quaeritorhiza haematococci]